MIEEERDGGFSIGSSSRSATGGGNGRGILSALRWCQQRTTLTLGDMPITGDISITAPLTQLQRDAAAEMARREDVSLRDACLGRTAAGPSSGPSQQWIADLKEFFGKRKPQSRLPYCRECGWRFPDHTPDCHKRYWPRTIEYVPRVVFRYGRQVISAYREERGITPCGMNRHEATNYIQAVNFSCGGTDPAAQRAIRRMLTEETANAFAQLGAAFAHGAHRALTNFAAVLQRWNTLLPSADQARDIEEMLRHACRFHEIKERRFSEGSTDLIRLDRAGFRYVAILRSFWVHRLQWPARPQRQLPRPTRPHFISGSVRARALYGLGKRRCLRKGKQRVTPLGPNQKAATPLALPPLPHPHRSSKGCHSHRPKAPSSPRTVPTSPA
jgi:hypothetical protein